MRGVPNSRIVLPEHFEFASTGFDCYFTNYIEFPQKEPIKYKYLPVTAAA